MPHEQHATTEQFARLRGNRLMLIVGGSFFAAALCSQLPAINGPIERAFISLGARDAVCSAYLTAAQLLRSDPGSTCSSALFGALVFMGAALLLLGVSDVVKARRRGISRSDAVAAMIFAAAGIYLSLESPSRELGASGEWSAVAGLFLLVAAIITLSIPLLATWFRRRPRTV